MVVTDPDLDHILDARKEGWREGMEEAAKIVERGLIYANRENPEWAQRIIAGEIRRRAGE